MTDWRVLMLPEAAEELAALPADLRARFGRLVGLIEDMGLTRLREPYVKHVEDKLWEMRLSGADGIARALYLTASGRRVVVLHVFVKKTQKTPREALAMARRRAARAGFAW
ncbi:MAG: type II toxin-antitoxin system RelE/ParE family toxin [Alphaproteobacteria bacterium]|nr:type II toxin-antitoxin system RelE/ParE family toxin [Alphaproteobacteria bacterium]